MTGIADEELCERPRTAGMTSACSARFFHLYSTRSRRCSLRSLPADEMRTEKARILRTQRRAFRSQVPGRVPVRTSRGLDPERVDDAWLLSRKMLYYTRLDDMEACISSRAA